MADRTDGSPTSVAAVPEIARLPQSPSTSALPSPPVVGDVGYVFAFDVAYDMTRSPVLELLGQPVEQYVVDPSKRRSEEHTSELQSPWNIVYRLLLEEKKKTTRIQTHVMFIYEH